MKILHTSDWHIGSTFFGKKRYDEYHKFFTWLLDFIQQNEVDALLVAGDIFDTSLPSNTAQNLYYSFLVDLQKTPCKHVVLTGGNHDSPSFLNAPKDLLKSFNIHVAGAMPQNLEDEIIRIQKNNEEAIILAVPYLRERDLQDIAITDSFETRAEKIISAIEDHYAKLTELALTKKNPNSPLIAMGHLYIAGSHLEDENERELYIGSLAQISTSIFPKELDYVALGHIHSAQKIAKTEHIRYCGSPLAMNFSEKKFAKKMFLLEAGSSLKIQEIQVPEFQITKKICGNLSAIQEEIERLKILDQSVWLEIEYHGQEGITLKDTLFDLVKGSKIEILKFKNQKITSQYHHNELIQENLEELTPDIVFKKYILNDTANSEEKNFSDETKQELLTCYHEILNHLQEQDSNE